MAISTYLVQLMYKATGSEYTKLVNIKDFPDLGGAPDMIETTTLSDPMRTYIPGVQDTQQLEFTSNYDKADFDKINTLADSQDFQIWLGPDGADGKFGFSGAIMAYIVGGGVSEAVDMKVVVTPSTQITKVTSAA